jgi:superfamily II DNA or RNA helicase
LATVIGGGEAVIGERLGFCVWTRRGARQTVDPMSRATLRLRPWQRRALDVFQTSDASDFLAVATPGAGKTTFALTAARLTMPNLPGRLVVVAPTRHLKEQWADAAQNFGLHLVVDWSPGDLLPRDAHGVVTTFQQVGSSPEPFFSLSQGGFVILDEIHHAGEERSWGDGVKVAFDAAARRLALSGTPFRSDTQSIPFVRYEHDLVVPDIEYGYGDALSDGGVVRPVFFPRFGGQMEWTAPDGAQLAASFDDPLARTQANQRLRAALSLDGEWLPTVLGHANEQLNRIRKTQPAAGGLVIAIDRDHARGIVRLFRDRFGIRAEIATSEDADASSKITAFAASDRPWIVAVRMISEGVDIPRLRVGVYATTTTTELFFRQAVGRIVRHMASAGRQRAYMFIPDDNRLRHFGNTIADSRRHSLTKESSVERDVIEPVEGDWDSPGEPDQMSLFAVHSATASEPAEDLDVLADEGPDDGSVAAGVAGSSAAAGPIDDDSLVIDLTSVPLPGGTSATGDAYANFGVGPAPDRNERDRLRRLNTDLTKELVALTGRPHAVVNGELNRRAGIAKLSEATIVQLNKRTRAAEDWLRQEHRRRRFSSLR